MTYIVKMMDNSEITVPAHVGDAILEAKMDRIVWNNTMINLKSVSSVIPYNEPETFNKLPEPKRLNNTERANAIKQMIKGLKKYMAENSYTNKSEKLLERMEKSLTENKSGAFNPSSLYINDNL